MYENKGKDLTLTAAGDAIINRRVSKYDEEDFLKLCELIREADTGFVNLETILHDYEGYPNAYAHGTYMRSPKFVADELRWMGFELFSVANNHVSDYLHEGMLATMNALEDRNITYAGLGRNLRDARKPAYLDSSIGRIGLVSCSSTFPKGAEAGEQRPDLQGRPGLSPLHLNKKFIVTEKWNKKIKELSEELGLEDIKQFYRDTKFPSLIDEDEDGFTFLNPLEDNLIFETGDNPGVYFQPKEKDKEEILKTIKGANQQADWVIVSLHFHEGKNGITNDYSVANYAEEFARECIHAGADMFFGHGAHVVRGIEIYDNKPIFYGLGNFFFQHMTIEKAPAEMYEEFDLGLDNSPADLLDKLMYDEDGDYKRFFANDMYWESFIPFIEFKDGELNSIELYPIKLGLEKPMPCKGRPMLARGEKARNILHKLQELSEDYGTDIIIEEEKGLVEL